MWMQNICLFLYLWVVMFYPTVFGITDKAHKDTLQQRTDELLSKLHHYETVIPQLVDERGDFLSYHVTHSGVVRHLHHENQARTKREAISSRQGKKQKLKSSNSSKTADPNVHLDGSDQAGRNSVFYKLWAYGREFHFNLSLNTQLLSKDFAVEVWGDEEAGQGRGSIATGADEIWGCHYTGFTLDLNTSDAAISNCNGLHGIFSTDMDDYFVEPLWNHTNVVGVEGHPHVVYSMASLKLGDISSHCGVKEDRWRRKMRELYRKRRGRQNSVLKRTPYWKWRPRARSRRIGRRYRGRSKSRRRSKRSVSRARHVETMVVVDKKMRDYHHNIDPEGSNTAALTAYILTIMNIVAKLFHNPTIGNEINLIITRLAVITSDTGKDLPEINYHADKSLDSFCKWQYRLQQDRGNNSESPYDHDNAILMTRYDICTYKNSPCGTLGLAPVESICDKHRSCSINQDIGLASAFTIAHEIGHNFGMHHDGAGNQCGLPGREPARIMAARLTTETSPFYWSSCSRKYVTDFLDSGKGWCLNNVPLKREIYPRDLPGDMHDINAQCRLQFGPDFRVCTLDIKGRDELETCKALWCMNENNSSCTTNSVPAAEGTECLISKHRHGWCFRGECRNPKYEAVTVHGSWGAWGPWGRCSRTCESGISTSERECDNPEPKDGGRYCIGQRKRYKSCNVKPCPAGEPSFRQVQCSEHDKTAFRGNYYKWVPYSGEQVKPCSLVCMAEGYNFYTERSPKVKDGTKCYFDKPHVCINGRCHFVGCDGYLGSTVKEDECRVCGGDNSTCKTISGLFDKPLPKGAYQEIVKIPKGAMHVEVKEARFSRNYLALKDTKDNYFINGKWTIDWPRKFPIASTVFHYKLVENEPESLLALGPTGEDLVVMVLLQEQNLGIKYQYNLPVNSSDEAEHDISLYVWSHLVWSACSKTCSRGISTSKARCVLKSDGRVVDEKYCDRQPKPNDLVKYCNEDPCPPRWLVGQWSDCSQSCGIGGHRTRRVACVQQIGVRDEADGGNNTRRRLVLDDSDCEGQKPATERECRLKDCPPEWHTFEWSECKPSCGPGVTTRRVFCMTSDARHYLEERRCRAQDKPETRKTCRNRDCPPPMWRKGEWGQCSVSCGQGTQERQVKCQSYGGQKCDQAKRPASHQTCSTVCEESLDQGLTDGNCEDKFRVAYCPLVLKFGYCGRTYFQTMCCKTCSKQITAATQSRRRLRARRMR